MISVGSRDARKGLGLGFGFDGNREMDETELEEGEAFYCPDDDDKIIDPDVALSYIDEKLHNVLGHFKKDFEGGVSAEDLGAKFGAYGSFLPTYQRSPAAIPRIQPKAPSYNTSRQPSSLQLEAGLHNPLPQSNASHQAGHVSVSANNAALPEPKTPSVHNSVKHDMCMPSAHAYEFTSTHEAGSKLANPTDQKTLKLRIKMGPDNLSAKKNAAIYSGLGLDVSPSSSLDDSPIEVGGLLCEPQDASNMSPNSILQVMTSFPVLGGLLLSPLPDNLICLAEKADNIQDNRPVPVHHTSDQDSKNEQRNSATLANGDASARVAVKAPDEKKSKSVGKNGFSLEMNDGNYNDIQNVAGIVLNKEVERDTSACENSLSNAAKLPLMFNPCSTDGKASKVAEVELDMPTEVNRSPVKGNFFLDLAKKEQLESETQEVCQVRNQGEKGDSFGKQREHKRENSYPKRDGSHRGEERYDSVEDKLNSTKVKKASNMEFMNPVKKASQRVASIGQDDIKMPVGKDCLSSAGRNKLKGSQSEGLAEDLSKENTRCCSSSASKDKRSTASDNQVSKPVMENTKLQKDCGKAHDRYRDFFGDIKLQQGDTEVDSPEMFSGSSHRDIKVVKKSIYVHGTASKERLTSKKNNKLPKSEACPKAASTVAPLPENGFISGAAPAAVDPQLNDNWVQCDKCQTWRLLPLGADTGSFPEKWMCSMLDWLPGMNRCSISEQETTNAVRELYHGTGLESQNNPDPSVSGVKHASIQQTDGTYQNYSSQALPRVAKKKHGLKEIDANNQVHLVSSVKNVHMPMKSRSLNDINHSPQVDRVDLQRSRKPTSFALDKQKHKKKHRPVEHYSDGADAKNSEIKVKREGHGDCLRASKKIKLETMQLSNADWSSDHGGNMKKVNHCSRSVHPINMSHMDKPKYSLKDSTYDRRDHLQASIRKIKGQSQALVDGGSFDMKTLESREAGPKKRKLKEFQDKETDSGLIPCTGNRLPENDHRKEKKANTFSCQGKELSVGKGNFRLDTKARGTKDQKLGHDFGSIMPLRNVDVADSLKRDVNTQPSAAANSSSSKVSGSSKTNINQQELKASPVESVSSSPLKSLIPDKFTLERKKVSRIADSQRHDFYVLASPKRCLDAEDNDRNDRLEKERRDAISTPNHHGPTEFFVHGYQGKGLFQSSVDKSKDQIVACLEFTHHNAMTGEAGTLVLDSEYPDSCFKYEEGINGKHHANYLNIEKSAKGFSSQSKGNNRVSESEHDKEKFSDSRNTSRDHEKGFQENFRLKVDNLDKKLGCRRGKLSGKDGQKECQFGKHNVPQVKDDVFVQERLLKAKQNVEQVCDGKKSSKKFSSNRNEVDPGIHKLPPVPSSVANKFETPGKLLVSGPLREREANNLSMDDSEGDKPLKAPKQNRKADKKAVSQRAMSRHPTPSEQRIRELDAPSPSRRDSISQAASTAVKEATDLKHLADRLKNSGASTESTGLYFEAALKFLQGAALLESPNAESGKHAEMIQSIQIYSSTAKLCEFCAHEYEKSKDMAFAALAYKCMEVAYLKVVYSSHASASRDRHELQMAMQLVPPGESPSSSASDVDNLNNTAIVDKVTSAKAICSPNVIGSYVIAARNRPNFLRLLNFAQDMNYAMEASRKSRIAFASANANMEESQYKERISSIKKALDFSFQDIEGLVPLIRLAKEAVSH